jgi:hypothetical protein
MQLALRWIPALPVTEVRLAPDQFKTLPEISARGSIEMSGLAALSGLFRLLLDFSTRIVS